MSRIVVRCFAGFLCALFLIPVVSRAQESVDGVAVERELLQALFDLDEQLELGTFPDGTGPWFGRLAAALERRGDRDTTTGVLVERLRRLDRSDLELVNVTTAPGDEVPWHRDEAARVLEAVDELTRHLSDPTAAGGSSGPVDAETDRLAAVSAGSLSGRVTDEATGAGIEAFVRLLPESGDPSLTVMTDPDGTYVVDGVVPGSYRVHASAQEYGSEAFDQAPCGFVCPSDEGTLVSVVDGVETGGIDFTLGKVGAITGQVTDSVSGDPTPSILLRVVDEGEGGKWTWTGSVDGVYQLSGVPPGRYFVYTLSTQDYTDKIYDDVPCVPGCDPALGTPVIVEADETVSGIDLVLDPHGSISGRVTFEGAPDDSQNRRLQIYDREGEHVAYAYLSGDGSYQSEPLPVGDYFLKAELASFRPELWDGVFCDRGCDVTLGDPVTVSPAIDTPGIDFTLERRGEIAGTVIDQETGEPAFAGIEVYEGQTFVRRGSTQADGTYVVDDLTAGTYRVLATSSSSRDELWDDLPCEPDCDLSTGQAVDVEFGATTSGIDFALIPYGTIAGTVTFEHGDQGLSGYVHVLESDGSYVTRALIQPDGTYHSRSLAPGTYRLETRVSLHRNEVYPDLPCIGGVCDVVSGMEVPVELATATTGVDFHLDRLGVLEVHAAASDTGVVRAGRLELYAPAAEFPSFTAGVSSLGQRIWGLEPGHYYLVYEDLESSYGQGYQDELFPDIPCEPECDLTQGRLVEVALNGAPVPVEFALEPCPWATVNDFSRYSAVLRYGGLAACDRLLVSGTRVASGGDITFQTGRTVVLRDGFVVEEGASFRVEIVEEWSQSPP